MKAPQPYPGNRVTFLRDGENITAIVQSIVSQGETVLAFKGNTSYLVRNDEVLRLVITSGVYGRLDDGSYRFSPFCKRERRR